MTVSSALTALNTDIQNARTAITTKGGTVTSGGGSSQLATDIATIPSGGSAPVIESLSVTPSTSAQTITAPSGTDGYSPISVAAVTAAIDNNIVAENIKKDVTILSVTGTYEGSGGGSTPAERAVKANYWVDTSGVVHNLTNNNNATLSANATSISSSTYNETYFTVVTYGDTTVLKIDLSALEYVTVDVSITEDVSAKGINISDLNALTSVDLSSLKKITYITSPSQSGFDMPVKIYSNPNLTNVDLSSLEEIEGDYVFGYGFTNCPVTSINLKSLKTINGNNVFSNFAGSGTSYVQSVDLSSLEEIEGDYVFGSFLPNNSTSFELNMNKLKTIRGAGIFAYGFAHLKGPKLDLSSIEEATRGTSSLPQGPLSSLLYNNTTITELDISNITTFSPYALSNVASNCTSLITIHLPSLTTISDNYLLNSICSNCTNLKTVNGLNNLRVISGNYALSAAFSGCTNFETFNLNSLEEVSGQNGLANLLYNNKKIATFSFPVLSTLTGSKCLYRAFRSSKIKSLSFPALISSSFGSNTNQFNYMLQGVTGCTVHFPSNLQSVIGSWSDVSGGFGGTSTTVLFDLPATS